LNSQFAEAYALRGNTWRNKQDLDKAIADFSRALEIDPSLAQSYGNRGLALLAKGHEAEAERDFEKCVRLDPRRKAELEQHIEIAKRIRATSRP